MPRLLLILVTVIGLAASANAQAVRRESARSVQKVRQCAAQMGPNVLTFTFYQPTQSRSEFCNDIPETGRTVIVVDTMQDELRDMTLELRIVKDPGPDGDEIAAPNVAYLAPSRFQTGVIELEHDFRDKGDYLALVRARGDDGGKEYNARFAFSVGEEFWRDWAAIGVTTLVALGLGAGWYAHALGKSGTRKTVRR